MSAEGFGTYLFEYRYEGEEWGVTIEARNADDAKDRLRALLFARLKGLVVEKIDPNQGELSLTPLNIASCNAGYMRHSQDQFRCVLCGVVWDTDEPRPPCNR